MAERITVIRWPLDAEDGPVVGHVQVIELASSSLVISFFGSNLLRTKEVRRRKIFNRFEKRVDNAKANLVKLSKNYARDVFEQPAPYDVL